MPRHDLIGGVVALVQERLSGTPASRLDAHAIDAMVAVNERFAGLLADRPDVPTPALGLGPDYPDASIVAALTDHSARSRRVLKQIRAIGESAPPTIAGDDLLHPDLTVGNVLYESGQVSGVVDWNWGAHRSAPTGPRSPWANSPTGSASVPKP